MDDSSLRPTARSTSGRSVILCCPQNYVPGTSKLFVICDLRRSCASMRLASPGSGRLKAGMRHQRTHLDANRSENSGRDFAQTHLTPGRLLRRSHRPAGHFWRNRRCGDEEASVAASNGPPTPFPGRTSPESDHRRPGCSPDVKGARWPRPQNSPGRARPPRPQAGCPLDRGSNGMKGSPVSPWVGGSRSGTSSVAPQNYVPGTSKLPARYYTSRPVTYLTDRSWPV